MSEESKDFLPTEISDEKRNELIKRAITSEAGWQALAQAVRGSTNPQAKDNLVEILKKIAGDRTIPVAIDNSSRPTNIVNFSDMLIQQLEYHLALVDSIKDQEK